MIPARRAALVGGDGRDRECGVSVCGGQPDDELVSIHRDRTAWTQFTEIAGGGLPQHPRGTLDRPESNALRCPGGDCAEATEDQRLLRPGDTDVEEAASFCY